MLFSRAITRLPGENFHEGITSVQWDRPPRYDRIRAQHAAYVAALETLGLEVTVLPPAPDFPDAYFVEDTAVMLPGLAVLTRPGELARRGEVEAMAPVLERFGPVASIRAPGLLDGGDVMRVEDHLFIGLSRRSNKEGARQLGALAAARGLTWSSVPVAAALHLKTGVNYVGDATMLLFEAYRDVADFAAYRKIVVPPEEAPAANTLRVNDTLLVPAGHPRTAESLASPGRPLVELDVSEVAMMDGGLSCLSLRF
jgi:dimethylargininase